VAPSAHDPKETSEKEGVARAACSKLSGQPYQRVRAAPQVERLA
jgi:hypothetical protein